MIALREYKEGDEVKLQEKINKPEISMMSEVPHPYTLDIAKAWIQKHLKNQQSNPRTDYTFVLTIDGELAGSCALNTVNWENKKAEVGYWLATEHWGKGVMTQALKLLIEKSFKELQLHRLYAYILPENIGSQKVLEKCGFVKEGVLKDDCWRNGKWNDHVLYGLVNNE